MTKAKAKRPRKRAGEPAAGELWRTKVQRGWRYVKIEQVRRPLGAQSYALVRECSSAGRPVRGVDALGVSRRLPFRVVLTFMLARYERLEAQGAGGVDTPARVC